MSAGTRYRHLFTPLRLGPVTVANRIVFSAHLTNYATDGLPTEQHAAYYAARAAGRCRPDHHRGALDPPDRLALREAHPRVPPRGGRRLPADHRRRPRPRRARSSPRSTTTAARPPRCTRDCRCGRRARSPTPCSARSRRRSSPTRSPRSSTATPPWPATAWPAASTASSSSAPTRRSCGASCPRPPTGGPTPTAARWPTGPACCSRSSTPSASTIGARPGPRGAHLRRRAHRGRHRDRGRRGRGPDGRGHRPGRLHQHLDRRGHGHPVHDRGQHAGPAGLRPVHPERHPGRRRPAGGRGRAVQGPAPGRPGPGRRRVRPGRRGPGPDRRPRLRRQGPFRPRHRHPHLPVLQPGVRRPDGAQPVARLHREPARRTRVGDRPPAPAAGARSWWSAAAPAGCRPPSRRPSGATGWSCSSGTTGSGARPTWPPPCPAGPSSSTSPAT